MSDSEDRSVVKKKAISVKFLVAVLLLGVIAYFAAPSALTFVMYLQEKSRAGAPAIQNETVSERPEFPS